jgi:hypothetical protein
VEQLLAHKGQQISFRFARPANIFSASFDQKFGESVEKANSQRKKFPGLVHFVQHGGCANFSPND